VEISGAFAALTGTVAIAGPDVVAVPPTTATCAKPNEADKTTASDNLLNIFTSRRASLPAFITRRKFANNGTPDRELLDCSRTTAGCLRPAYVITQFVSSQVLIRSME
jgi:hypothetical protein